MAVDDMGAAEQDRTTRTADLRLGFGALLVGPLDDYRRRCTLLYGRLRLIKYKNSLPRRSVVVRSARPAQRPAAARL